VDVLLKQFCSPPVPTIINFSELVTVDTNVAVTNEKMM
jgi:hypothetical protein